MKHLLPLLDPRTVPSPCFVLDEARLAANAAILDSVQQRTGAKILLDDFGSGFSSFGMLKRYNFDILKLDMTFTRQIETRNCTA